MNAEKIIESIDSKTTMVYDDNTDQSVYYRYEDVIEMINIALSEPTESQEREKANLNIGRVSNSDLQPQLCKDCEYHNPKHKLHHSKCKPCYFYNNNQQSNFNKKLK